MRPPIASTPLRLLLGAALLAAGFLIGVGSGRHLQPMRPTNDSAEPPKGAAPYRTSTGVWHTQGSSLLDAEGKSVKIVGLNWSGFETVNGAPGGLKERDQDLRDLTSMEILDKVVSYSQTIGLKLILDNHRSDAGGGPQENGLWFTPEYPESSRLKDWADLARRYANTPSVVGFDLRNEPHDADGNGACWDCGGPRDWHLAAQRAGNAILNENSNLLIIVEGTDEYRGDRYWWGSNLEGVRESPVELSLPNRLVYSAHEYGPMEYPQPWFTPATISRDLEQIWVKHWAFGHDLQIAPVYLGEFGTANDAASIESNQSGSQGQWFSTLVAFLSNRSTIGWTYWSANGEDRYAYFDSSYSQNRSSQAKVSLLDGIRSTRTGNTTALAPGATSADCIFPSKSISLHTPAFLTPETSAFAASVDVSTDLLSTSSPAPFPSYADAQGTKIALLTNRRRSVDPPPQSPR